MIRLQMTSDGARLQRDGRTFRPRADFSIDALFRADDPCGFAEAACDTGVETAPSDERLLAPIGRQEVWAAGVTYLRSKHARMAESKDSGGGSFYDKVYEADRPELFFKGTPHRVAAPGSGVRIRGDSKWNVPEPELTLAVNAHGRIFGFTIGNDMSSRDIEGENPLYLPQAKVYDRSTALGPALVIGRELPPPTTEIRIAILRGGATAYAGAITIDQIKRPLPSLAHWLFRDNSFPDGVFLMTGTGLVPPDSFTLAGGDEIRITIEPVGTLINPVL